jgi:hypothetical protein
VVFALAAVVTLGGIPGVYLLEKLRGRAAWAAYEREALQRGVKLEFSDYIPPQVPDAENFASIPIFDAVFRASDANQKIPDPFELPGGAGKPPQLGDLFKQKRIDLAAWQKFFVDNEMLAEAGDNPAADVLTALDRYSAPLQELREAGNRPHCRFPVHWEKAFAAALPHGGVLQNAAKLHALRVSCHLALGDSAAAYQAFRDGLRLATAIRDEPSLILGLVRLSIVATMQGSVWDGLAGRQWDAEDLRKIEGDLASLDWLKDYTFAMSSERGGTNLTIDLLCRDRTQFETLFPASPSEDRWTLRLYPTGWFYQSQVRANHFMDELLRRVEPDRRRYFGDRPVPSSPKNLGHIWVKVYYMYFATWSPMMEVIVNKFVQGGSVTDQMRLACALERFRLERGAYPTALAELTPAFIPEVPVEIVNGESYRYQRTDDGGFLLYSVGMDLHDDGGVVNPALTTGKQKDWVLTYSVRNP